MPYRILVDENTSPRVAESLRDRGYEADHVGEVLSLGVPDREIINYANEHGYVVLTHDDDFLLPKYTDVVPILYYSDDMIGTDEIIARVEEVITYVPNPRDLPPITNLGSWE
jgi:hypothetical protein